MDEAESLCDRIAIVDRGQVVALDTPQGLIQKVQGGNRVRFTKVGSYQDGLLEKVAGVTRIDHVGSEVVVYGEGALLAHVASRLAEYNIAPADLRADRANLEDVFLSLTGKEIRE
jgi:ABC-2 type transport system ATP-binding protein